MPLKRKASELVLEPPAKRRTRSSGLPLVETQRARTQTSPDLPGANLEISPYKRIRTYGRARGLTQNLNQSFDSLKENGGKEDEDELEMESSEDELILSPSKLETRRNPRRTQVVKSCSASPDNVNLPIATRLTRGKAVERTATPIRKQPKRGQPQVECSTSPTKKRRTALHPLESPPHHADDQTEESDDPLSPSKYESARTTRSIASPKKKPNPAYQRGDAAYGKDAIARNTRTIVVSPAKQTRQTTRITRTSPSKQSTRQQPIPKAAHSEDDPDSPSPPPSPTTKYKTTVLPERHSTPHSATTTLRSNPSSSPLLPLRFDSVAVPPLLSRRQSSSLLSGIDSRPVTPLVPITIAVPTSPSNVVPVAASATPTKRVRRTLPSPTRAPHDITSHLHPCLNAQKRAILQCLQNPSDIMDDGNDDEEPSTNAVAFQQLESILAGSVTRGEGNSCLLLGPRGSGKTRLVERSLSNLSEKNPIILRLSGWTQHTDRLAMREIARQLGQQTGGSFLSQIDDVLPGIDADGDETAEINPFLDAPEPSQLSLPPASHLPALISVLPTLERPTIVILDGFDLFALHPRQSLLYCLLDTAQSCRATVGSKGLAVIGITSRIDTITILEKRVKSRFSGRMLRTAPPPRLQDWENFLKEVLSSTIEDYDLEDDAVEEWNILWDAAVRKFRNDRAVQTTLNETFSITRDVRMLSRMLLSLTLQLTCDRPFPSPSQLVSASVAQRARPRFPLLHTLPYPEMCLLIASVHAETAGHAHFTFEMLHEYFRDQVRASTSAPVQVNGGSIGMVRCSRQVLMTAFEELVTKKIFISVNAFAPSIAKEFVKCRSAIDRDEVKKAVDKMGQVNLRKWLTKAQ
ncbi:Origin recognition complex subunit 4 [Hypsizygus marmoreus]|uniref:Origin recognition complex subunit 4 n=1 Tax=Hypsizygus marmoreus TaxID=39966 RepID=A0A369JNG3_HYPMA|nr:Origin recognition complex subunit 4 [Hypsizygus marmoreus]